MELVSGGCVAGVPVGSLKTFLVLVTLARCAELVPDSLHGRGSARDRWHAIPKLDDFFTRVYEYFLGRGFWCILFQRLFTLLYVPVQQQLADS